MSETCVVCLRTFEKDEAIEENSENTLLEKLKKCVPELEWSHITIQVCRNCNHVLNVVYDFKEMCIKSYSALSTTKPELTSKIEQIENDENETETENQIEIFEEKSDEIAADEDESIAINIALIQDRIFHCTHCTDSFKLKIALDAHLKSEHAVESKKRKRTPKEYCCKYCRKKYTTETGLLKHSATCSKADKTDTEVVTIRVEKESEEKDDSDFPIGTTPVCHKCGNQFSNKYLLQRHIRNVHATEKKFKCEQCDAKFVSPVYLKAHQRYHTAERRYICATCGKGFITTSDLYHHEKIHANKRAYCCEICAKTFNTSSDIHKHRMCVHTDRSKWKYACSFCERRFPLKTNLDMHTKGHTGEKKFACHLCDRKCINRSVLKRHVATHRNETLRYKCEHCTNSFKLQKSLDAHMAKAHQIGAAQFHCDFCPKVFVHKSQWKKHLNSHVDKDLGSGCIICGTVFTDEDEMEQHMKSHVLFNEES